MFRSMTSYRPLALAAGLCLLAACAETTPPVCVSTVVPAAGGPQLAGAWYQVFFDSDATEINARGQIIIQTVANVVKNDSLVRVTIVGKTDRVGSATSNVLLSQQRAGRIRDALLASAVPADRIDTSWAGESKQEVMTRDNIAEQRNRVVDITVQHPF